MVASSERSPRRIFQPFRGRALRKLLWKRLHLPRSIVHPALSAAKAAANPGQVRLRRQLAEGLASDSQAVGEISKEEGFLRIPAGVLPGADDAAGRCAEIFRARRVAGTADDHLFNPRKRFLLALLSGADFCAHPQLLGFMVSRPVLDAATVYLGTVPILAGAALWWTPENDTAERSQLFHFDAEDDRQVKLILNVFDTEARHGPFTLLPADVSEAMREPRAWRRRISDEDVDATCGLGHAVSFVGAAGSGGFVDTCRCLHFGSRHTRADRLVLMVQFTRFHCPTESTFDFAVPPDGIGLDLDPIQKLALGIE